MAPAGFVSRHLGSRPQGSVAQRVRVAWVFAKTEGCLTLIDAGGLSRDHPRRWPP